MIIKKSALSASLVLFKILQNCKMRLRIRGLPLYAYRVKILLINRNSILNLLINNSMQTRRI